MSKRSRELDSWRIRRYVALIRQVRGRTLLEALFRLQDGTCAYDGGPVALLIPQALARANAPTSKELLRRLATIDHVNPRARGGANRIHNLVLASQGSNCDKGDAEPLGTWTPSRRFTADEIRATCRFVDGVRWTEAARLASAKRPASDDALVKKLVRHELTKIAPRLNLEFYDGRGRRVT